jgi:hypothetical protein
MKLQMTGALAALLLAGTTLSPAAHAAEDYKYFSVANCAPYTSGTPNYNLLRFRPESVQNQSNGYLYVICPLIRDTENSWEVGSDNYVDLWVYFRTNTAGNFQCTLTVGSNRLPTNIFTSTKSVSGNPGEVLEVSWIGFAPDPEVINNPAALVCRLPPGGSIVNYRTVEHGITDAP